MGSGGQIDEDAASLLPDALDQVNRSVEIAVEGASRKDAISISCSVELELVHAISIHHLETCLLKGVVVLRAGEGIPIAHNLEAMRSSVCDALLLLLVVASPGRQPHAYSGVDLPGGIGHRCESVREATVEGPQGVGIVPPVVEEEGI